MNDQNEIFCEYFLLYGNATKAYKLAGYTSNNPGQCAHEMLKRPDIKEYLAQRRSAIREAFDIKREDILNEYKRCAFSSAKDLVDEDDKPLEISEMTVDAAASISSMDFIVVEDTDADGKVTKKRVIEKIRRVDKLTALAELARMLGVNTPTDPTKNKTPLSIDEIEIVHSSPLSPTQPDEISPAAEPKPTTDAD